MARTLEWRKEWVSVEDPEESPARLRLAEKANNFDKENEGADNASVGSHSNGLMKSKSSRSRRLSSATDSGGSVIVDIDDDNMSSVSSVGFDRMTLPDGTSGSVATGASTYAATVVSTLFKRNIESLFEEILDWISDTTGMRISEAQNNSATRSSTVSGSAYGEMDHSSARMHELLDSGRPLVSLLDKSGLVPGARTRELAACRLANSEASLERNSEEREKAAQSNFALFDAVCREQGLPSHFIAVRGDRNSKRIVGCFVLLSRCARANNSRAVRKLVVSPRVLNAIGLRPDEMTVARPQPSLQEMQLRGAFWVPDGFSPNCLLCDTAFGFWNGAHHCRACGTLCCHTCSSNRAVCLGYKSPQRICNSCYQQRKASGDKI